MQEEEEEEEDEEDAFEWWKLIDDNPLARGCSLSMLISANPLNHVPSTPHFDPFAGPLLSLLSQISNIFPSQIQKKISLRWYSFIFKLISEIKVDSAVDPLEKNL